MCTDFPEGIYNMRLATAFSLVTLLATATLLSACNTTAGAGQDISSAGHAVTGAAESAK